MDEEELVGLLLRELPPRYLTGTIFENTNEPLKDWFRVLQLMLIGKKGCTDTYAGYSRLSRSITPLASTLLGLPIRTRLRASRRS
jgi:hypothetical protein